jgi:hypothetical protein
MRFSAVRWIGFAIVACRTAPSGGGVTPPAPTPAAARDSVPPIAIFGYLPGRSVYDYTASATVSLDGDTARNPERVTTRAQIQLDVGDGAVDLPLVAVVDSFAATSTSRIAPSEQRLATGVRVTGTVSRHSGDARFAGDSSDCTSPAGTVRLLAREVLPPIPDTLPAGRQWSDTTETLSCRGGALLRSRSIGSYVVEGPAVWEGIPVLRVRRRATVTVEGAVGEGTSRPSVRGSGTESATMDLDLAHGRVSTSRSETRLELLVTIGQRTQRFVQVGAQEIKVRAR